MADKEDEWEEEKEKLLTEVSESLAKWSATFSLSSCCVCVSQIKGLEDEVSRLTSQISCLQAKVRVLHLIFFTSLSLSLSLSSLSRSLLSLPQLNQAQQQQRQPGPYELAEAAAK